MNSPAKTRARRIRRVILALAAVIIVLGASPMFFIAAKVHSETQKTTLPSIDDVPRSYWRTLADKTIFFGHHSIGNNILAGVNDVMAERPYIKLNIVRTCDPTQLDGPAFAHDSVGLNTDPDSKMRSFRKVMEAGLAEKADIAFFKFCFIDFRRGSDPVKVFDQYETLMQQMQSRYPHTTFLNVTVPITSPPRPLKGRCKEYAKLLLGRPLTGDLAANALRQQFNTMMRDAYSEPNELFDLAKVESISPQGYRCYSNREGRKIEVLAPGNTFDGGHLNETARKTVAEQLLIMLANLANSE